RVRRGRPRDAGVRRARVHTPPAVRAHLPPPPPLPDHRGQRGDPDPQRRRAPVRLCVRPPGDPGAEVTDDSLGERLRALASSNDADDGVAIEGLTRLTGGASRETWAFDARRSDGAVAELILRRGAPREMRADAALEAGAIAMAREAGVPEPRIVFHSDDPAHVGAPCIVMERVVGETLARRILRDEAYAAPRPRLAGQCGEILARIHALDARELGLDLSAAEDQLESLAAVLAGFEEKRPALEVGLRWLDTHRPPSTPPTVVHGDFRLGNLIIGP